MVGDGIKGEISGEEGDTRRLECRLRGRLISVMLVFKDICARNGP